ncbi:MAG: HAD family hydrolase [Geminicoccaceae bacterium]
MSAPDLSDFDLVLLDMNGTFMFGHDRFGQGEDYYATYKSLGGSASGTSTVHHVIHRLCEEMSEKYRDIVWQDQFPSVRDTLLQLPPTIRPSYSEIDYIVEVIAAHELGDVPNNYSEAVRKLAQVQKIGVVSNLWSNKSRWIDRLKQRGLLELFEVLVFSSDGPHIKPSIVLFERALRMLHIDPARALFVGDDRYRDIAGAAAAGMKTVLVGNANADCGMADWQAPDFIEFVKRCAL